MLDCGTLRALAEHVRGAIAGGAPSLALPVKRHQGESDSHVHALSSSGRWPASCSFPQVLAASADAIGMVPAQRWSADDVAAKEQGNLCVVAVSYTHLTLPTILLV